MATFTSTQSGNFSSSATWGGSGVPSDGDSFNVASGHTVTIDSGISVPTNGYADSNIYGILQSQLNTPNTLRMNGRLYVQGGGTLHSRKGAKIQIKGTSGDQHGIWVENATNAHIIMEGSDGMNSTYTSSAVNIDDEFIPVNSSSGFSVGEHISIFDVTTTYTGTDHKLPFEKLSDEGFWIHDISGNNIYFRHYVSPEGTIVGLRGSNKIILDNAKLFRVGQKIIFNTGSNRNIHTISKINFKNNVVTLDSNIVNKSSQKNQKVYLTGIEKNHVTNSKVRKVATVSTTTSSNTSSSVIVANASDFSVGDDIYIERQSEADGSTDYDGKWNSGTNFRDMRHTITSISGNTITVSQPFDYTVLEGSRVVRLTRDVVCETVATDGSDYGFLYVEYTSAWNRVCILKDVYFKNWGNDDSNHYTGVVLRGLNRTSNRPVTMTETVPERNTGSWVEGLSIYIWPDSTHQRDWGPLWLYDCRSTEARNCITLNGDDGISVHYEPSYGLFNNITAGTDSFAMRLEGPDGIWETAYNHTSRGNYGYRLYAPYSSGKGFHSNSSDAMHYGLNLVHMSHQPNIIYKCKFTGHRYGLNSEFSEASLLYTEFKSCSGFPQPFNDAPVRGTSQDGQYRSSHMNQGVGRPGRINEHNFEIDRVSLYGYRWESFWDVNERAWRVFVRYDSSGLVGPLETIYVPAGTTLRVSAKVKMDPEFNGSYPYLGITDTISSNYNPASTEGNGAGNRLSGNIVSPVRATSASLSDYEELQLTYGPYNYPSTVMTGVYSSSNNSAEGWWVKDFRTLLDQQYASPAVHMINKSNMNTIVEVRRNFSQAKRRIGGRLR